MKANPNLTGYNQADVESLFSTGYIVPNIDANGNLIIQNVANQMYSSSITIPLENMIYNEIKVKTGINVTFAQL